MRLRRVRADVWRPAPVARVPDFTTRRRCVMRNNGEAKTAAKIAVEIAVEIAAKTAVETAAKTAVATAVEGPFLHRPAFCIDDR